MCARAQEEGCNVTGTDMENINQSKKMSGRSGESFAAGLSGRGNDSGRGGRGRQGAAQKNIRRHLQEANVDLTPEQSSADEENIEEDSPPPSQEPSTAARARTSNQYALWTEEKRVMVLQAVLDTPRRMVQNPPAVGGFERNTNKSGLRKISISMLDYGDMGKVVDNACLFLSTSPSFLLQNKQKIIQSSTVTNKLRDWQRSVKNERDLYQMGPEAFYELATHSESKKLIIHLMQQQEAAQQRQDRERQQHDHARNDNDIGRAIQLPPVPVANAQNVPSPVPQASRMAPVPIVQAEIVPEDHPAGEVGRDFLAAQAHYAAIRQSDAAARRGRGRGRAGSANSGDSGDSQRTQRRVVNIDRAAAETISAAAGNSQSSHPAAVAPNRIQVWSASHGSSNTRKRILAVAGGQEVPASQRPSVEGYLPDFMDSVECYRAVQEMKGNAAMLSASVSAIEFANGLSDDNPIKQSLMDAAVAKAKSILALHPASTISANNEPAIAVQLPDLSQQSRAQLPPVQPPADASPGLHLLPLNCSVCHEDFEFNRARQTYVNVIFTPCQHGFHPECLGEHRRSQSIRNPDQPSSCPICRAVLPQHHWP